MIFGLLVLMILRWNLRKLEPTNSGCTHGMPQQMGTHCDFKVKRYKTERC